MRYGGSVRNLKSEFVVAPGGDPANIRLRYGAQGRYASEESGALAIPLAGGRELREEAPAFIRSAKDIGCRSVGRFRAGGGGSWASSKRIRSGAPLMIDPVISYSTLLGGAGSDAATAVAVDAGGAAYVAGFTASYDFPTAIAEQNSDAGGNDGFVAKLNPREAV